MQTLEIKMNRFDGGTYLQRKIYERIRIDYAFDAVPWCERHGMSITKRVQDENGRVYDIWEKPGKLICAIPVRGEAT